MPKPDLMPCNVDLNKICFFFRDILALFSKPNTCVCVCVYLQHTQKKKNKNKKKKTI